ncbi:Glyoxalase/Bleomycin resistance protein/Dihydroxybiphenyl dioxygenase [Pelagophyceae sp. CCMP2097]|nr:Glyoxalase/Bleomycin resistance protein/Dihydroxybiphenyl dioxygenase [Pelagophyceae sp. CCMP2097]
MRWWALALCAAARALELGQPYHHHVAVRTRNIENSMKFYSLFGLEEIARFRIGVARCAWVAGDAGRLELIEVPESMDPPAKARDLLNDEVALGLNHIALDVTHCGVKTMDEYLTQLNLKSEKVFSKSVKLVVPPYQQIVGKHVFELAFVQDPDGALVELLNFENTLDFDMEPDW